MILIADSGSTKTDWRLINEDKSIYQFLTKGISPYFMSKIEVIEQLRAELLPEISKVSDNFNNLNVHFYGTGCSTPENKNLIEGAIDTVFSAKEIIINHDLLAAAYSLCGNSPGMACILGTGSNSCLYNGKEIIDNVPSLGLFMGDEGSGGYIGKQLIRSWLYREMPQDLAKAFELKFGINKEIVLDNIYKKPFPNRYLATLSKWVFQNQGNSFLNELIINCFRDFFTNQIFKYDQYKNYTFNCVGSVGFYYSNYLRQLCNEYNISVGSILESPISGLTLYHLGEI